MSLPRTTVNELSASLDYSLLILRKDKIEQRQTVAKTRLTALKKYHVIYPELLTYFCLFDSGLNQFPSDFFALLSINKEISANKQAPIDTLTKYGYFDRVVIKAGRGINNALTAVRHDHRVLLRRQQKF